MTDDWYALGDPDSTGTAGDYQDHTIQVVAYSCYPFLDLEPSFVLLNLPPDTWKLPVYLKVPEGTFPGFEVEPPLPYIARLGKVEAYQISQQGFPDRAYFMFRSRRAWKALPSRFPSGCLTALRRCLIFPLSRSRSQNCRTDLQCDLGAEDCKAAGGRSTAVTRAPTSPAPERRGKGIPPVK